MLNNRPISVSRLGRGEVCSAQCKRDKQLQLSVVSFEQGAVYSRGCQRVCRFQWPNLDTEPYLGSSIPFSMTRDTGQLYTSNSCAITTYLGRQKGNQVINLSICLSLSLFLSFFLSSFLSFLSICLSVCLPICLSLYPTNIQLYPKPNLVTLGCVCVSVCVRVCARARARPWVHTL